MIIVFLLATLFILIIGFMLLFAPGTLARINAYLNKTLINADAVFSYRITFAVILILVGLGMLYSFGYYVHHRP